MADLIDPVDIDHDFGADLGLSATGDLARVNLVERSQQRVLRRLLTNPGDYLMHPTYGAGLPAKVGSTIDIASTTALIKGQMLLEASVMQNPPPSVTVAEIENGMAVAIAYSVAPDATPAVLSFSVTA
jgi:hypothetical protein